jgi:hypothetical protein
LDYTTNRAELVSHADKIFGWLQEGKLKVSVDTSFAHLNRPPKATCTWKLETAKERSSTISKIMNECLFKATTYVSHVYWVSVKKDGWTDHLLVELFN